MLRPVIARYTTFDAPCILRCPTDPVTGNSAVFWQMLTLLACCDKSTVVALEAIKALAGASYPIASNSISSAGSGSLRRPPLLPDEHAEADVRVKFSMAWNLLVARADDDAPGVVPAAPSAAQPAVNKQFTISRCLL